VQKSCPQALLHNFKYNSAANLTKEGEGEEQKEKKKKKRKPGQAPIVVT